jgi:catechol 2,3-dioxygenase-like lactoylglutathione lyase family enzyme
VFYIDRLGFPVLLEVEGLLIFGAGGNAIAIRGPDAKTKSSDSFDPFRVGLDHLALACADPDELRRVADALSANGIQNTGVKMDATLGKKYVAFKDPDGIAWEFYMV